MKTKVIVITGGVYSSLGKGIIASSIGCILTNSNFKVSMLKLDPYLNIKPGLLSPYQHGEVFVTQDGAETDLDLGHYERFTGNNLTKYSTTSAGSIYYEVLNEELTGKYNGSTIQVIPHITNKIQDKIKLIISKTKPDFLIIEIGGTIGDIEQLAFIEALRIFATNYGKENILFIHSSPLFQLSANNEIKTKPTQHSMRTIRNEGINPSFLILRNKELLSNDDINKLSWSCDIDKKNIFVSKDCENIYMVPKILYEQGIQNSIFSYFKITKAKTNMDSWFAFLDKTNNSKKSISVAIIGEYPDLYDAYFSLIESLKIAAIDQDIKIEIKIIDSSKLNQNNYKIKLKDYKAIIVPDSTAIDNIDGMVLSSKYARENDIPYLAISLGLVSSIIDILDIKLDNFINTNKRTIKGIQKLDISNSNLHSIYNEKEISERYCSNFICKNIYKKEIEDKKYEVIEKDNSIQIIKSKINKFYLAVQFRPEFETKPNKIHPIFKSLIKTIIKSK